MVTNLQKQIVALAVLLLSICMVPLGLAALPLTPSTTYVPNSAPPVKAADLNALQQYLAGLYSGVFSVKAVVADGTGGNAVAPLAGSLQVSASTSGFNAVAPFNTSTVPWGQLSKEGALLGSARCTAVGGVLASCGGTNIKSVSHLGGGLFRVDFNSAGSDPLRHVVAATAASNSPVFAVVNAQSIVAGAFRVDVQFYDLTGSGVTTTAFHVVATGG